MLQSKFETIVSRIISGANATDLLRGHSINAEQFNQIKEVMDKITLERVERIILKKHSDLKFISAYIRNEEQLYTRNLEDDK